MPVRPRCKTVRSVKQLIALAKAHPGQLNYASVGIGSATHLSGALFNHMAGVSMMHIPYKGTGQVMPDLLGGQVALHFGSTTVVPYVKTGKLVALGVSGAKRSPALPQVPTIAEKASSRSGPKSSRPRASRPSEAKERIMSQDIAKWDDTTRRLVDYARAAHYEALPELTVRECKRRVIDTFASALGAYHEPPARMARAVASRSRGESEASVWGSSIRTTPEAAAFANGVMVRLLDISDTYLGKSRGHPSDMTSGVLAAAESVGADGKSVINAIALAYDVYCSFCDAVDINSKGWDQPVYSVLGCVLGVGRLLELTDEQMGNALSLAPNMALAQSRRGHLSMWKGCAGANASRNAVFAAMLAKEGFTGPTAVFEGEGGLHDVVGAFEWPLPAHGHMITQTHVKSLPVCYHGQSSVLAALELRAKIDVAKIEDIGVDAYRTAVMMMGGEPSRWAPTTRETADHSLPYCVSIALLDGAVTNASFAESRLRDPVVASFMSKVKVREDAGLSAGYPEGAPGRVTIRMISGETHTLEIRYPTGHAKSPMSDEDVERKFRDMLHGQRSTQQCDAALAALNDLEHAADVGRVIRLLAE